MKKNNSVSISLPKIQNRGPPPHINIPIYLLESLNIDIKKRM